MTVRHERQRSQLRPRLGGHDDHWPDFVVVNAGTLDDDPGTRPLYHIYVGSKAPWFTITDSLTQFATAPQQDG